MCAEIRLIERRRQQERERADKNRRERLRQADFEIDRIAAALDRERLDGATSKQLARKHKEAELMHAELSKLRAKSSKYARLILQLCEFLSSTILFTCSIM